MLDVVDGLLEQDADVVVVQCVNGSPSLPFADDELEMSEQAKLVRDSRLLHLDRVGQLTDRAGRLAQPGEDADAA